MDYNLSYAIVRVSPNFSTILLGFLKRHFKREGGGQSCYIKILLKDFHQSRKKCIFQLKRYKSKLFWCITFFYLKQPYNLVNIHWIIICYLYLFWNQACLLRVSSQGCFHTQHPPLLHQDTTHNTCIQICAYFIWSFISYPAGAYTPLSESQCYYHKRMWWEIKHMLIYTKMHTLTNFTHLYVCFS